MSRFRGATRAHYSQEIADAKKAWDRAHFGLMVQALTESLLKVWVDALLFSFSCDPVSEVVAHHDLFKDWLGVGWARAVKRYPGLMQREA